MKKIYYVIIIILSFISITLALLDISNVINLNKTPYFYIDKSILVFFWIDYLTRLIQSKNKKKFFVTNLFDLLAIIPFDAMFYLFRIFRVIRLLKLLRLIRVVGFTGKVQKIIKRFFNTNGFIYLVIATIVLILTGAEIYSVAENSHYLDSLWWAIATTTTVGYGDISPHTAVGKLIAVILMILGIGLIGSVTSTVTAFFLEEKNSRETLELKQELVDIQKELHMLRKLIENRE